MTNDCLVEILESLDPNDKIYLVVDDIVYTLDYVTHNDPIGTIKLISVNKDE